MSIVRTFTRPTEFDDAGFGTARFYRDLSISLDIVFEDGVASGT